MKLGIVTYQWGANWERDLPTLIKNCAEAGYAAPNCGRRISMAWRFRLSKEQRAEVQKRFVDSGSGADRIRVNLRVSHQRIGRRKKTWS